GGVHRAALATAALLGGADLVVEQDRDAGGVAQVFLDLHQLRARLHLDAGREVGDAVVTFRFGGHDDGLGDAFGGELTGDLGGREAAFRPLAAGHGDGGVGGELG